MGRTPLSTNRISMNNENKTKSKSSVMNTSSLNNTQSKKKSHNNRIYQHHNVQSNNKENMENQSKLSSDISGDEEMEQETISRKMPRKLSAVHDFVKKLSSQAYECQLCLKVKLFSSD